LAIFDFGPAVENGKVAPSPDGSQHTPAWLAWARKQLGDKGQVSTLAPQVGSEALFRPAPWARELALRAGWHSLKSDGQLAKSMCERYGEVPEFKQFDHMIDKWAIGSAGLAFETARLLASDGPWPENGRSGDARALLDALAACPAAAPKLYRGLVVGGEVPVADFFAVGKVLSLLPQSFTSEKGVALAFATGVSTVHANPGPGYMDAFMAGKLMGGRRTPVLFTCDKSARALSIAPFSAYPYGWVEHEWISAGKFLVTAARRDDNGIVHVDIRQLGGVEALIPSCDEQGGVPAGSAEQR